MAEIIDHTFRRKGRPEKYPWSEWSDGQTRVLTRSVDFDCEIDSLTNTVHQWARRHGFVARTERMAVDQVAIRMIVRNP